VSVIAQAGVLLHSTGRKIFGKAKEQTGKKPACRNARGAGRKRGLGEMNFCPPVVPRSGGGRKRPE